MKAIAEQAHLTAPAHRRFLWRRLHSLSGVVPVGVFLIEHLWTNATALRGQTAFDLAVEDILRLPFLPLIEAFGIFLPLAFHAGYGVKLAFEGRPNVAAYPYARNWLYTAQRLTGLLAFAFIAFHLWEFRVAKLLGRLGPEAFYPTLSAHLSSTTGGFPLYAAAYLLGIAASTFHFANGLGTFVFAWGLCVSARARRRANAAFALVGAGLFVTGAVTTLHFATGARLIPSPRASSSVTEPRCYVVDRPAAPAAAPPSPSANPRRTP